MAGRLTIIGGGVMGRLLVDCGCLDLVKDSITPDLDRTYAVQSYKFAPWAGKVLAQLAAQRGTVYDIGRFTPARFDGGAMDEPLAGGMAS